MTTIGSQGALTTAEAFNTPVTLNSNVYALLTMLSAEWGTKLARKYVANSNVPMYYNTEFDGSGEMEVMMSTDQGALITTGGLTGSRGQVPFITLNFTTIDQSAGTTPWQFTVAIEKSKISWADNKEILIRASFAVVGLPTHAGN